jgi:hypothetical protein
VTVDREDGYVPVHFAYREDQPCMPRVEHTAGAPEGITSAYYQPVLPVVTRTEFEVLVAEAKRLLVELGG